MVAEIQAVLSGAGAGFLGGSRLFRLGEDAQTIGTYSFDVDGDGRHDIYFVTQVGRNELWRNLGGGRFADMTEQAGIQSELELANQSLEHRIVELKALGSEADLIGEMGEMLQALKKLHAKDQPTSSEEKRMKGLILDLRGNPGGALAEAVRKTVNAEA